MSKIGDFILGVLFPRRCVGCGKLGTYYCPFCIKTIELLAPFCIICNRPSFDGSTHLRCKSTFTVDGVFALSRYKSSMKRAIRLLKYHSVFDLTSTLSSLLVNYYPRYLPHFDILIPVPLHRKREMMRGYNQSKLLANSLGSKLTIPVVGDVLVRSKYSKPQVDLRGDERRKNIIGAFSYHSSGPVFGKTIGIVDDVTTTGATLLECGKILKSHGAKTVWGIVLAHGN